MEGGWAHLNCSACLMASLLDRVELMCPLSIAWCSDAERVPGRRSVKNSSFMTMAQGPLQLMRLWLS